MVSASWHTQQLPLPHWAARCCHPVETLVSQSASAYPLPQPSRVQLPRLLFRPRIPFRSFFGGGALKMATGAVPRIGIGVLLFKGDQVLVGKRLSKTGNGEYALPGGLLEFGESLEACASRELKEETGIAVPESAFAMVAAENTVFSDSFHCVSLFMRAAAPSQDTEAENTEPDKCAGWQWVSWPSGVPSPVFRPLQALIDRGTVKA